MPHESTVLALPCAGTDGWAILAHHPVSGKLYNVVAAPVPLVRPGEDDGAGAARGIGDSKLRAEHGRLLVPARLLERLGRLTVPAFA